MHVTQGFLTGKHSVVTSVRHPPWWVPHWVKFQIFSFVTENTGNITPEAKLPKIFTVVEGVYNAKLSYLKFIAINRTIQPLLFNINKWNLKVLISDFCSLCFSFISICSIMVLGICCILLQRLKCPLSLSSEEQKVSLELYEKNKYKCFSVRIFFSASSKICSWLTRLS